jgi:hypothetical protein
VLGVGNQRDSWNGSCVKDDTTPGSPARDARRTYAAAECAAGISVARRKMLASSLA